jgi:phosphate transport system substrate-binding protein
MDILGAGASFPFPLYSKIFDSYNKETGTRVNYQPIGSGGGIRQLFSGTVDFAGSDAFLKTKDIAKAKGEVLHIPTALGAVAVVYHLDNIPDLKLTSEVITDLYLGDIKYWNDRRIQELNPNIKLPNNPVLIVGRSDGSGTTYVFSDFLSKSNPKWKKEFGAGKAIKWKTGIAGKGNPGVAGIIKQTPGAIGYVELEFALKNKLKIASIKNKSGNFIQPSIATVLEAAKVDMPKDLRIELTNTNNPEGYPISTFTWILLYKEQNIIPKSKEKAQSILSLISWVLEEKGQSFHTKLNYAPLPDKVKILAKELLQKVTYNGKLISEIE